MLLSYQRFRRIRQYLDHKTAATIGTALVHSKLDYCNSLFIHLSSAEINRLQLIQNSLARAVCCKSKFSHITPVLKSLHWLKVQERIKYKLLSLVYKVLTDSCPEYISSLISIQQPGRTRSSSFITLSRPSTIPRLSVSDRAFQNVAPQL